MAVRRDLLNIERKDIRGQVQSPHFCVATFNRREPPTLGYRRAVGVNAYSPKDTVFWGELRRASSRTYSMYNTIRILIPRIAM